MAAISDAVVIGIVLGLVFAAVSYYLYSRMTQLERKVGFMENILLDLKITTEQTILGTEEPTRQVSSSSQEELDSYHSAIHQATEDQPDEDSGPSDNVESVDATETLFNKEEEREVLIEQQSRTRTTTPSLERVEKSNSPSLNYEAMTYKELTALAKQVGISGLRNLSKAHVIDALKKRDGSPSSSQPQQHQTELSSWATGTVNFSEEQDSRLELDSFPEKQMETVGTLDAEELEVSLVQ